MGLYEKMLYLRLPSLFSLQPILQKMNDQSDNDDEKTSPLGDEPANADSVASNSMGQIGHGETLILQSGARSFRLGKKVDGGDDVLNGAKAVSLVIRGMVERISFAERTACTVGRTDHKKAAPDIDLSSYGADQRGVSREHIRLEIKDDQLFLTDLGSTNGTALRTQVVTAFTPYLVHNGDEIILGRLVTQIVFD